MAVFDHFYSLAGGNFSALNSAMIALLPEKDGATCMGDFRLISLIHSIAKVLSMRLAAITGTIISPTQSAFQRAKCIHDSLLFVPVLPTSS